MANHWCNWSQAVRSWYRVRNIKPTNATLSYEETLCSTVSISQFPTNQSMNHRLSQTDPLEESEMTRRNESSCKLLEKVNSKTQTWDTANRASLQATAPPNIVHQPINYDLPNLHRDPRAQTHQLPNCEFLVGLLFAKQCTGRRFSSMAQHKFYMKSSPINLHLWKGVLL